MLLTLSGRGRLSHPPNRSTIQSKNTPDLYTEEGRRRSRDNLQECQILFSGKNKKNISISHLPKKTFQYVI